MATLNSIDGVITSGGNNPTLNTEFPVTLYRIEFAATGGSITYVKHNGQVISLTNSNLAITDRVKQINSMSGIKLTDLGLVFNIPLASPPASFIDANSIVKKDLNLKTYKVYFGNPYNVSGQISYINENGVPSVSSLLGTTTTIKTTKINSIFNVRLEDLNPEVPAIKKVIPPPIGFQPTLSLATGTYGTISSPISNLTFLNAPIVPLVSGGDVPVLNKIFAATSYTLDFPEVGTGTIEYIDNNGKLKTYTLNKLQVMMPDGLLRDGIIQVNKLENVKLKDLGLVYQIVETTPVPNFIKPTSMPLLPSKPKFYQVYFGNPVYPQGSITYFDANGANKSITNFGKIATISAYSIYSFFNVKIVEVGDYVDNNGNSVPSTWINPQNPEGKYPKGY